MNAEPRNIIVMGPTGHMGKGFVREALAQGHKVTCIIRKGSEEKLKEFGNSIDIASGDPTTPGDWTDAFSGQDQFVHLIGIIKEDKEKGMTYERVHRETARLGIEASKAAGVKWISFNSAAATPPGTDNRYLSTKREVEDMLEQSGIDYTVFRPSLIYGEGMMFNAVNPIVIGARLATILFPVFTPIDVRDLIKAHLVCYQNPEARNHVLTYQGIRKLIQ